MIGSCRSVTRSCSWAPGICDYSNGLVSLSKAVAKKRREKRLYLATVKDTLRKYVGGISLTSHATLSKFVISSKNKTTNGFSNVKTDTSA